MPRVEDPFMIKDLHRRGMTISDYARIAGSDRKRIRSAVWVRLGSDDGVERRVWLRKSL